MSDLGTGRADLRIVRGDSAGVLATPLSAKSDRPVLLLEAGTAYGVDGYPAAKTVYPGPGQRGIDE
jgi:hypothetical protein